MKRNKAYEYRFKPEQYRLSPNADFLLMLLIASLMFLALGRYMILVIDEIYRYR